MNNYDLRDYYTRMEAQAALLMEAQPEWLNKDSAEEAWSHYKEMYYKYNALCVEAKP